MNEQEAEEQGTFLLAMLARLENLARDIDRNKAGIEVHTGRLESLKWEARDVQKAIQVYFGLQKEG